VNPDWRSRYETAIEEAQRAAKVALSYFEGTLQVEWKGDLSPVTIADRETENILRTTLAQTFPYDGFHGEEYGDTPGSSGFRWIIDPIDGTRSFVRGIPLWATLLGLEYKDEQIAGVAAVPALGHVYRALRGDGAFRNNQRIAVSKVDKLSEAMLFYSSISWFMKAGMQAEFLDLAVRTQRQRGFGDFYGFVLVAQGSGELMVEYGVHAWDVAALKPIVEEAGGRYSCWDGSLSIHQPDVLVSNGKLHDEVLRLLRGTTYNKDVQIT
jgi:histidinol-phosphatase